MIVFPEEEKFSEEGQLQTKYHSNNLILFFYGTRATVFY